MRAKLDCGFVNTLKEEEFIGYTWIHLYWGRLLQKIKHAQSDCVAQYTELPSVEDQIRLYLITTV